MSLRTPSESWEVWTRPVKKILAFFGGMVGLGMVLLLVFSSPPPEDRMSRKGRQAPAAPLVPTPKPRVYVTAVVDQVCRILLNETTQVTQCYTETVPSGPSYRMVIHGRFSAAGAQVMCHETAREVGELAERLQAYPVLKWRVQVHSPYTGSYPLAACWMYR